MNHEIAMLQSLSVCNKYLKKLNERCLHAALNSFSAHDFPNGTVRQIEKVAKLSVERDDFLYVMSTITQLLKSLPKGYRALLVEVYVKNVPKQSIATKYGVSISTVYRKLSAARACFREQMQKVGCDASWFEQYFQNYQCALDMFRQQSHEGRPLKRSRRLYKTQKFVMVSPPEMPRQSVANCFA